MALNITNSVGELQIVKLSCAAQALPTPGFNESHRGLNIRILKDGIQVVENASEFPPVDLSNTLVLGLNRPKKLDCDTNLRKHGDQQRDQWPVRGK